MVATRIAASDDVMYLSPTAISTKGTATSHAA
jgi:hypothetical protein